jgi:hypothetical protein
MSVIPLEGHGALVFNVFTVRPENLHWDSEEAFRRGAAKVPWIAATRQRVPELIEGTGPRRFEIVG